MPGMRPISSASARPQPAAAQRSSPVQISAGAALASDRLFVLSCGRRKNKSERCEMRLFQIARAIISSSAVAGFLARALSWRLGFCFFFQQPSKRLVWCVVTPTTAFQFLALPNSFFFLARSDDGEASEPST